MHNDYVLNPDLRIITTLCGLADHFGKEWCKPRQNKILELLARHTGRAMSRRNLNRHLGALCRDGWMERIRRHKRAPDGSLELHSTVYRLKRRAKNALRAISARFASLYAPAPRKIPLFAVPKMAQTGLPSIPIVRTLATSLRSPATETRLYALLDKMRRR